MVKWDYGDAWERYPVKPNDLWVVGPHRLACCDIETGNFKQFLEAEKHTPEMVYFDPPWGPGNARSFRTKANSITPEIQTRQVDFSHLVSSFLDHIKAPLSFMEMGNKETPRVIELIMRYGWKIFADFPIYYYNHKPSRLIVFGSGSWIYRDASGMSDDDTPIWAMQGLSAKSVVLDLCIGRGIVAEACVKTDHICWGNELNPRRLAVTIDKLVKLGGYKLIEKGRLDG